MEDVNYQSSFKLNSNYYTAGIQGMGGGIRSIIYRRIRLLNTAPVSRKKIIGEILNNIKDKDYSFI